MTNPPQGNGQGWNPEPQGGQPQFRPQNGQPGYGPQPGGGYPNTNAAPADGVPPQTPTKRTNTPLIVLVSILVLALIVGGVVLAMTRGGGGKSTAAADAVASTADAVITVNLEPNASKRLEMYQFFSKFPSLKEQFDKNGLNQDADFKRALVESMLTENNPQGLTYEADFEPWLGSTLAAATQVVDNDSQGYGYLAIESTDDAKAREALSKMGDADTFDIVNGYAVIWSQDHNSPVEGIKAEPMSQNADYKRDTSGLAGDAPIAFWMNEEAIASAGQSTGSTAASYESLGAVAGRVAGTIDVNGDSAQVSATTFSDTITKAEGNVSDLVKGLSDDADLVVASSMSESQLNDFWKNVDPLLSQNTGDLPLQLPDDLFGVLTPQFAFTMDTGSFAQMNDGQMPKFAIATKGGDLAAHQKLAQQFNLDPASSVKEGDTVISATTPQYAQSNAKPSKKLGDNEAFKKAVKLSSDSNLVVYWNPSKLAEQDQSDATRDLRAISSVSVVGTTKKDHESTIVLSVTAK